jgi:protein-disulfide isomerase
MSLDRRTLLSLVGTLPFIPALARADDTSSPYGVRSLGSPDAKVTVTEYFSQTCSHCAEFANDIMPQIEPAYIKTGKLRIIYRDFPLDAIALMAAQVARSLPVAEYYPFVSALFANQNDWAFGVKDGKYADAIFKYAALAGMDRPSFDAALNNDKLKTFILNEQTEAEAKYKVNATPTFIINGEPHAGAADFADFSKLTGLS